MPTPAATDAPGTTREIHPGVRAAAYAVPLCTVPSVAWRVSLYSPSVSGSWYLLVLSLLEFGLALLTVGLVHQWGEKVPGWIPVIGDRHLPLAGVTSAAIVGALLVTIVTTYGVINRAFDLVTPETARSIGPSIGVPGSNPDAGVGNDIALLYAPVVLWGPLLFICAVSYYRRRSAESS